MEGNKKEWIIKADIIQRQRNFLEKVLLVKKYCYEKGVVEHEGVFYFLGLTNIWKDVISPKYGISERMLEHYLKINHKKELKKLDLLCKKYKIIAD